MRRGLKRLVGAATAVLAAGSGIVAIGVDPAAAASPADVAVASALAPAFAAWDTGSTAEVTGVTTDSPQALRNYGNGTNDLALTDVPFQWLAPADRTAGDGRGYQYVPIAGDAVGVTYNIVDKQGNVVTDLAISRATLARIFLGKVRRWSDPHLIAENGGRVLPDEPIQIVYPRGESGVTAAVFDFAQHVVPDVYGQWAADNGLPTDRPVLRLDDHPTFAPRTLGVDGSAAIADYMASAAGRWSISYDALAHARAESLPVARVINRAGNAVTPSAATITQALVSASVNADLTPNLDGVYDSTRPTAYPLSHYDYAVVPCVVNANAPTCKGTYADVGIAQTVTAFLRYVACAGQGSLAALGYAPLPPVLSQGVANAIGRMNGAAAEQLTAANCSNPTFANPVVPEVPGEPEEPEEPVGPPDEVFRLRADGRDRIETSVMMSEFTYNNNDSAAAVVLARADDSVDALAGTPLAVAVDGPLLITPTDVLDPRVSREILRVLPAGSPVYLLGGTNAISPLIETLIRAAGYDVRRLAGNDRYATSVLVADAVGPTTGIMLATGRNVADALGAGAAAGFAGGTVVLTDDARMPPVVDDYLRRHPDVPVVAIGGPAAGARPGVQAIVGADRYATSALVASIFFPDARVATFANGTTPDPSRPTAAGIDAISGGVFSARVGAPVLLVEPNALPVPVADWLTSRINDLFYLLIYGGDLAVSEFVAVRIEQVLGLDHNWP